jgi:hypothetical protein
MQRIVSGDGIQGLTRLFRSFDQDNIDATTDSAAETNNNEVLMSDSTRAAFDDDAANFIENEDEDDLDVTMDVTDGSARLEAQEQQGETEQITQSHNSGAPSLSISGDGGGSNSNDIGAQQPPQQQQQPSLSFISGLLPNMGFARNDSRNSGTTNSFASGLQRSQNSSRDWGWFEDVHHSDLNVIGSTISGGVIGSTRTAASHKSDRTSIGGSVASSGANRTSLPQHQLTSGRTGTIVHAGGVGTSGNETGGSNIGVRDSRMAGDSDNGNQGGAYSKKTKNNRHRASGRGDTNTKTASLLPTGDEMLIDEMQEYLEPILILKQPRDMENGKNVKGS